MKETDYIEYERVSPVFMGLRTQLSKYINKKGVRKIKVDRVRVRGNK